MAGAAVATTKTGDVTATPNTAATTFPSPAVAGTWSAGPITPTPYSHFKVAGAAVIWKAVCVFTLTGATDASSNAVTPLPTSTVTLTAAGTTLQAGSTFVLRRGHTAQDTWGNKLDATPAGILTTA